jgi:hypothetical protein
MKGTAARARLPKRAGRLTRTRRSCEGGRRGSCLGVILIDGPSKGCRGFVTSENLKWK